MADAWDPTLEEWVTSEGYCYAAGMAGVADGSFYAAAPVAGDEGWGHIFAEDHTQQIMQEDMTEEAQTINEAWQLQQLVANGKKPDGGVWFAKQNYKVVQVEKGAHVVSTGQQIVVGFYSD